MAKFTQSELAEMHESAMRNAAFIEGYKLSGRSAAEAMNVIFDSAMCVCAVWRNKRGRYDYLPLKGAEHARRVIATGIPEAVSFTYYDPGVPEAAYAIEQILREKPGARWFDGGVKDGQQCVGLGLPN